MLDTASRTAAGGQRSPLRRPGRRTLTQLAVIAGLLLFAFLAIPQLLSLYYIDAMTQVAVYSVVALGLGVLVGRVGLVSLGQVAVLTIGAWVPARPGLGGDPAERAGGAGRGDQHHAVQAVGVRARLVHHRRGRRRAGGRRPLPVLDHLPDPGVDHTAGRGADGRRLQHVGRDRG